MMTCYFAVVQKEYPDAGRNGNQTYVNVVRSARRDSRNFSTIVSMPPWNDPEFTEFIVEIDQQQYEDIQDWTNPLTHDGFYNMPRFQVDDTPDPPEIGSFVDPTNSASNFQQNVPIPDLRFILRAYDGRPSVGGNEISDIELNTSDSTTKIYVKLFNENDVPMSNNNVAREEIGGQLMEFPFGSSHPTPAVQPGETSFDVATDKVGRGIFGPSGRYRWVLLSGAKEFVAVVYGRELHIEGS